MKKTKTPLIVYALYFFAALIFICGFVEVVQGVTTFAGNLQKYTFAAMDNATKWSQFQLFLEPLMTYGFQVCVLMGIACACKAKAPVAAAEEDFEEMEEATFGTVLTAEDLEEAKSMVEAAAAEIAEDDLSDEAKEAAE